MNTLYVLKMSYSWNYDAPLVQDTMHSTNLETVQDFARNHPLSDGWYNIVAYPLDGSDHYGVEL
jgi:hypothetical protein